MILTLTLTPTLTLTLTLALALTLTQVGYPHLLRELRGSGLAAMLAEGAALLTAAAGGPLG